MSANVAAPLPPPVWWRIGRDGTVTVAFHVQPGAKRSEVAGPHGDALKIKLAAPPVDGKANASLLAFVAAALGLPKAAVSLKSGQTSRQKVVEIHGAPADGPRRLLAP